MELKEVAIQLSSSSTLSSGRSLGIAAFDVFDFDGDVLPLRLGCAAFEPPAEEAAVALTRLPDGSGVSSGISSSSSLASVLRLRAPPRPAGSAIAGKLSIVILSLLDSALMSTTEIVGGLTCAAARTV